MTDPVEYPDSWKRSNGAPRAGFPAPSEAVAMAIDAFIAALSPEEFDQLVARTRG
jgi:hypothetical protein